MLVITTREGLYYNYDENGWSKDAEYATIYEDYEIAVLVELIENQDFDLEVRNTMGVILHANYAKAERITKFLS